MFLNSLNLIGYEQGRSCGNTIQMKHEKALCVQHRFSCVLRLEDVQFLSREMLLSLCREFLKEDFGQVKRPPSNQFLGIETLLVTV